MHLRAVFSAKYPFGLHRFLDTSDITESASEQIINLRSEKKIRIWEEKRMNVKRICTILAFFSFLGIPVMAFAQKEIVLTGVENMYLTRISEPVLAEAYRQLGIKITTRLAPGERALVEANDGRVDGDLNRKTGLEQKYQNLIMVPVSVVPADWVVFTKQVKFAVKGWKSLQPYSVVLQRGLRVAVDATKGMNQTIVTSMEQMFKMLADGRVEIAVATRIEGLLFVKKLGLKGIMVLEPSLQKIPLYHYLHKKHTQLVPKLTAVLQDMEQKGKIKEIQEQEFQKLMQ